MSIDLTADPFHAVILATFWVCSGLVVYTYLGYPVLVWAIGRVVGRRPEPIPGAGEELPTVSVLLAAFNEEAVIGERLRNALATDYPAELLEIVVGSDGSTDHTAAIVGGFECSGVRLLDFPENRGKASVLNDLVEAAKGEVLVMSDANTDVEPGAIRSLVRWFRDPRVGAVVGRLVLIDPETGRNVDGLYWKYETFLKLCEARLGALLGANGAIYALRRDLYEPIPVGTIIDDFVIPLRAKLSTGCSIIYDPEAVASEETSPDVYSEFHRRARIGAGGYQAIAMLYGLVHPRQGWTAVAFVSHKLLRWVCPFLLLGSLVSNLLLAGSPLFLACLCLQLGFYAVPVVLASLPWAVRPPKVVRLISMFVVMNLALVVGFWRWVRGRQKAAWRRTARSAEVDVLAR